MEKDGETTPSGANMPWLQNNINFTVAAAATVYYASQILWSALFGKRRSQKGQLDVNMREGSKTKPENEIETEIEENDKEKTGAGAQTEKDIEMVVNEMEADAPDATAFTMNPISSQQVLVTKGQCGTLTVA